MPKLVDFRSISVWVMKKTKRSINEGRKFVTKRLTTKMTSFISTLDPFQWQHTNGDPFERRETDCGETHMLQIQIMCVNTYTWTAILPKRFPPWMVWDGNPLNELQPLLLWYLQPRLTHPPLSFFQLYCHLLRSHLRLKSKNETLVKNWDAQMQTKCTYVVLIKYVYI